MTSRRTVSVTARKGAGPLWRCLDVSPLFAHAAICDRVDRRGASGARCERPLRVAARFGALVVGRSRSPRLLRSPPLPSPSGPGLGNTRLCSVPGQPRAGSPQWRAQEARWPLELQLPNPSTYWTTGESPKAVKRTRATECDMSAQLARSRCRTRLKNKHILGWVSMALKSARQLLDKRSGSRFVFQTRTLGKSSNRVQIPKPSKIAHPALFLFLPFVHQFTPFYPLVCPLFTLCLPLSYPLVPHGYPSIPLFTLLTPACRCLPFVALCYPLPSFTHPLLRFLVFTRDFTLSYLFNLFVNAFFLPQYIIHPFYPFFPLDVPFWYP